MAVHIGSMKSRVTISGKEADLTELVLELVLERLRGAEAGTLEEAVISERLTPER